MEDTVHVTTRGELYAALTSARLNGVDRMTVIGMYAFGEFGEDGRPGLNHAIRRFVRQHLEWSVVAVTDDTLTLSCRPGDKPRLPSLAMQAWNYAKMRWGEYWLGDKLVSDTVFEERLSHCWLCPKRSEARCTECGCYLDAVPGDNAIAPNAPGKCRRAAEECPIGKWLAVK